MAPLQSKSGFRNGTMKSRIAFALLLLSSAAQAQSPKKYHTGRLLQMESLQCTVFENQSSAAQANDATVCQEYVVQGEDVLFHLRARDTKRPVFLPVGKQVGYRVDEGNFYLLLSGDRKEHQYVVVSMETRTIAETPVQASVRVNHLQ
jgi:hypothetical protein